MGAVQFLCLILTLYMYGTLGLLSFSENKNSDKNGLLPSTVSGKASNVLRDILNQESIVRFSMVQKIQNLVMDAIDNKNSRQVIKTTISKVTKELQDLETKSQIMEEENVKLKEELKVMYGTVNENRNFTIEEILRLNQTELLFIKSNIVALQEENIELALKNADTQNQLDLLNKHINLKIQGLEKDISKNKNNSQNLRQVQSDVKKDIKTLKLSNQSTLEKIRSLNESQIIFVENHLQKMNELDGNIRNETVLLIKNADSTFAKETKVLKDQMNKMNGTLQKSGVDVLTGRLKTIKDIFRSFSVSVNKTLDNVLGDLNETRWILSAVSVDLVKVAKDFHSCWDILRKFPILKGRDGVYTITVASEVKSVYCDMSTDGGGWTAIQRRQDGSTDFYRTWKDYKQGFGDPSKNYWIGNDAIYELTKNKDQELRVELQSFDGAEAYAQYSTFYIGDEGSKYRLTVSGYSGIAGDSLAYHNGRRFSTKDKDNDGSAFDCATYTHGAWWYRGCAFSNLNGEYAQSAVTDGKCLYWYDWKIKHEALQKTIMMLRQNV